MTKLSRWLRCLFSLSLNHDEKTSLKCIEQATHLAATKQGVGFLSYLSIILLNHSEILSSYNAHY